MAESQMDLIVVGSGFGGAVCGLRAAEAGMRVVVLERGCRMSPAVYDAIAAGQGGLWHSEQTPGLLELHRLRGLLALTASAVGGGSNIYTGVTLRAPSEAFDSAWPDGLNRVSLEPWYARVEAMTTPSPIPVALPRTGALESVGRRMGAAVTRMPLSMDWPADPTAMTRRPETDGFLREAATWLRGGRAARKRTLEQTYLSAAERCGAEIRPLHEVRVITPQRDGYRVEYRERCGGAWRDGSLWARRLVLAAGALNTTRLLLRCRDVLGTLPRISEALGRRFFTNGDFGGLLVGPEPEIAADAGPPVTAWIDLWDRDRLFVMETGLVPFDIGSFAGLLNPARWFSGIRLAPARRCTWSFGTMGANRNAGKLVLGRRGRLRHRHDPVPGAAFCARTQEVLEEIAGITGGRLIVPPSTIVRRMPITVHPLGGAVMAESPDAGVTDPFGEVFGHSGLYVADGSLVPSPTGVPPSMTIAALAERVAEHLISAC